MFNVSKLIAVLLIVTPTLGNALECESDSNAWQINASNLTPRHEAGLVSTEDAVYLLGGRGVKAIEKFDPQRKSWVKVLEKTPLELHHFQPVFLGKKIYIMGAFTGGWPNETPVGEVLTFDVENNHFETGTTIPEERRRGAAAVVTHEGKLYVIGGIQYGHMSGAVNWFDEFDPETNTFKQMPDAPHARDHVNAVVVDNKLYLIGGRVSSRATGDDFNLTTSEVDMYDFVTGQWQTLSKTSNLPTPRAGANVVAVGDNILVIGGESGAQTTAHAEVELFNTNSQVWSSLPQLELGRHSGGAAVLNDHVIAATGSGNRGGAPELGNFESLHFSAEKSDCEADAPLPTKLFAPVSIDISGPMVTETDQVNPFTDYVMWTQIEHESGRRWKLRGYFAADGKSEYSSASRGNQWRTKFTPAHSGKYSFKSRLYKGDKAAISDFIHARGKLELISEKLGGLVVSGQTLDDSGFNNSGFLSVKNGYFYFQHTNKYWLKGGSNSPENMLGYWEIDGTYRASKQARDGEAAAGDNLHHFPGHVADFKDGDPLWGDSSKPKGKGLIGAINYLAEQGINSQYFLTMNINGDGRDVWPYLKHETFDRFDVSKLAQWDLIFQHMQDKGILLHLVTQETENETLLDNGDVGDLRKLYYLELIARFSHHKALVWNLGEENGPEAWTPVAQNDDQRVAMAKFISDNDPYRHAVLIHSHSNAESKHKLLPPLLDSEHDGISFQVDYRQRVFEEIREWRKWSAERTENTPWLITMDEIGKWYTGAKVDKDDPTHDSLRRHVLWPTFLAGGAGVEWYAGARQPHNDLSTEDFRVRESLWNITRIAREFIEQNVPIWELTAIPVVYDSSISIAGLDEEPAEDKPAATFYGASNESYFLGYVIERKTLNVNMPNGTYQQIWLDPISGKTVQKPDLTIAGQQVTIVFTESEQQRDWVVLLKKTF